MRTLYHPAASELQITSVLYALSDPTRLHIVRWLAANGEQSCSSVPVSIAKSTVSHHFKVLRESGITRTRLEGTQRFITLRRDDLDARFPGLLQIVLDADEPANI